KSRQKGKHTTVKEHMPRSHQAYLEWTPSRIVGWAEKTGPATAALAAAIMEGRAHPQQGFRSCLGVMRLGKEYGPQRLEAACVRALAVNAISYRSVRSILQTCLDKQPLPGKQEPQTGIDDHPNIRGSDYYH
ncbi:MAG: IS21 family transposase, partial [Nitrospinota bacterium]|nr:IS21 family transposase [Nitrospinota bacterium]